MENILFSDLKISQELLKAISDMGFEETTPIQTESIMPILEGRDVVAQAPTGTGKTCAFGIPLIESIDENSGSIAGLVLCPTRELVIQTTDEFLKLAKYKKSIKVVAIYGGQQIDRQIFALKKKPQIIIATPGRLMDHLRRHTIKLDELKYVVLDEADEMLNMGFREDIDVILESVPEDRQTVLFSATISKDILNITKKYQKDHVMIKVTHKEITVPTIEQLYIEVKYGKKADVLTRIIDAKDYKLSIVFCNTKRMVDELTENLITRGYSAEALHGDMKQMQRDKVMARFKNGNVDMLVATDVAARGIDVDNVEAVFNYDIPSDEEYYVHRIGRTGRANKKGVSYTFVSSREVYKIKDIMKYTKSTIKPMKAPSVSDIEEIKMNRLFSELLTIIAAGEHHNFISYIEKLADDEDNDATSLDIAAALLSKFAKNLLISNGGESESGGNFEGEKSSYNDATRLFINVGSLDKVKKRHILELFKDSTSMKCSLLRNIDIFDKYSFVDVPSEYADSVMLALNGVPYKGRTLSIEKANVKQRGERGERRSRGKRIN